MSYIQVLTSFKCFITGQKMIDVLNTVYLSWVNPVEDDGRLILGNSPVGVPNENILRRRGIYPK